MRTKNAVGRFGEDLASRYLTTEGLVILERNWRCGIGEIDIVAREGGTLVICEVKTRRGLGYGSPFESITYRKLTTLRKLAGAWLRSHEVHPSDVRIDFVSVLLDHGAQPQVEHLRGAA
ncbi:YraN family protein [Kribbella sp. NPDC058245]|uniref:YraN family protein n=1 Tax=Kribbella sp. NPDC058245 TaxID=3346399 RepID=UPI0036E413F2